MADDVGMVHNASMSTLASKVRHIQALLNMKRVSEALTEAKALAASSPENPDARRLLSHACWRAGELAGMSEAAERAFGLTPRFDTGFVLLQARLLTGQSGEAMALLPQLEAIAQRDYAALRRLTDAYVQCGQFEAALRCARGALALRPGDIDARFNIAPPAIALGQMEEAEAVLDAVLEARPDDWEAHYLRSTLRKQTIERNHVDTLTAALVHANRTPRGAVAVGYALGKELEDLGRHEEAFGYIKHAATTRRKHMSYDVAEDIDAMEQIARTFSSQYFQRAGEGYAGEAPIFIIGMPRSGTTLIDRVLSQHQDVESRGELSDLPLVITRATPGANTKSARIEASAALDPNALGQAYARSLRGWGAGPKHLIDKSPLNFLYIGLIATALPNARIVHVTRHPMASGYAMYKTYFRMAYPFSYDLKDTARYLAAYRRLMRHWDGVAPGRILHVAYEDVVEDIEREARRLLDYCELAWDPVCIAFHENKSPSATASAAQVRRPLYRDSLDQWRRLAHRLSPLAEQLRAEGVDFA